MNSQVYIKQKFTFLIGGKRGNFSKAPRLIYRRVRPGKWELGMENIHFWMLQDCMRQIIILQQRILLYFCSMLWRMKHFGWHLPAEAIARFRQEYIRRELKAAEYVNTTPSAVFSYFVNLHCSIQSFRNFLNYQTGRNSRWGEERFFRWYERRILFI